MFRNGPFSVESDGVKADRLYLFSGRVEVLCIGNKGKVSLKLGDRICLVAYRCQQRSSETYVRRIIRIDQQEAFYRRQRPPWIVCFVEPEKVQENARKDSLIGYRLEVLRLQLILSAADFR